MLEKTISQVDPKVIAKTQHTLYIHTCHASAISRAYDMFVCCSGFVKKIKKIYIETIIVIHNVFKEKITKLNF